MTQAQLNDAVATLTNNSSANSNGVALLDLTVSDPPTQGEMQAIVNKINEDILARRRT